MNRTIALLGNPNAGKTTLFNALTGTYQKTGNWTGVTTEKKIGEYRKDKRVKIIDLPGLYSLSTFGDDEKAVKDFLTSTPPMAIINIVDGTNLERNLYLTSQLIELKIPVVIAVNMMDDLEKNGIKLNVEKLSETFGVPVVLVSALKNKNVDKLMETVVRLKSLPKDLRSLRLIGNTTNERYEFIERNVKKIIQKKQTKAERFTQKADDVLTHKIWGFPIFFAVMTIVYVLSIRLGGQIGSSIAVAFERLSDFSDAFLSKNAVPEWLNSLTTDAIIKGMGTVASFLPQVLILFSLLAVIEESGYASRIAFILDRFFRSFGLGGKSLIPITLACGCTVTGLMSTRTIEDKTEKRMTIFLAPFMPCGAKTAVFGWVSYEFFGGSALIASSMYFLGMLCIAIFGKVLKKFKAFSMQNGAFILEIPTLRRLSVKDIIYTLWEKTKDFTAKAGAIVFLVTVGIWFLQNFGFSGYTYGAIQSSFLYIVGNALKFLFYPLGFGSWQTTVATLSSFLAKEAVVESLKMVSSDPCSLFYNGFTVYAFMSFVLLSPPCVASISTAKRELKSNKWVLFMLCFQFSCAYIVAFIINGVGLIISLSTNLILTSILVIIILSLTVLAVIKLKKTKCTACSACAKGSKCIKRNTI